ncbi:uncharacterized protein LOC131215554 [Anopheles bellator]|uniref:uncharacterized protein LOC131215554 n=1 Tax=Anopheles bellator TaxID=139047 RepID=UPI002648A867|nr:uncharacterized protein LOC131215554 [Anopheles bellator]
MDIFHLQCSESLGFDSMLSANHLGSPVHDAPGSPNALTYAPSSPFFAAFSQPSSQSCVGASGTSSGPNDVILPSIFVKIPTQINQQYQQETVRHRSRNANEIKCEDRSEVIKSEIADLRSIVPQVLPASAPTNQLPDVIGSYLNDVVDIAPIGEPLILRCDYCPFATLTDARLLEHKQEHHDTTVARMLRASFDCPVCENKFYKCPVLELHLLEDHEMARNEVEMLMSRGRQTVYEGNHSVPSVQPVQTSSATTATTMASETSSNMSRIYIKDVQLLKNPGVIAQETHGHGGHQSVSSDRLPPPLPQQSTADLSQQPGTAGDCQPFSAPSCESLSHHQPGLDTLYPQPEPGATSGGSKIFIRNVSLLQSANFAPSSENMLLTSGTTKYRSFMNAAAGRDSPNINASPPIETMSTANEAPATVPVVPRANRIYIKNVDILRNPISSMDGGSSSMRPDAAAATGSQTVYTDVLECSRASSCESVVCTSTPPPPVSVAAAACSMAPATIIPMSQIMPPVTQHYEPSCSLISAQASLGPELAVTFNTSVQNQLPEGTIYSTASGFSDQESCVGPTAGSQKSKIFIKNISVLKQPTIHLKSVDEVNLMTYDELQLQNLVPSIISDDGRRPEQSDGSESQPAQFADILNSNGGDDEVPDGTLSGYCGRYEVLNEDCTFTEHPFSSEAKQNSADASNIVSSEGNETAIDDYATDGDDFQSDGFPNDLIHLQPAIQPTDVYATGTSAKPVTDRWPPGDSISSSSLSQDVLVVADLVPPTEKMLKGKKEEEKRAGERENDVGSALVQVVDSVTAPKGNHVDETTTSEVQTNSTDSPISSALEVGHKRNPPERSSDRSRPRLYGRPRGRPKGAKQTGITKLRKLYTNLTPNEEGYSCDQTDCGARFRQQDCLDYHRKCHAGDAPNGNVCPECGSHEFRNWTTLHTHLWRQHGIDMELHACQLCSFKTPVLARLLNTHMLIHSDERNFKCGVCAKAFKNNKQLRNHRRSHRDPSSVALGDDEGTDSGAEKPPKKRSKKSVSTGASESQQALSQVKCVNCPQLFTSPRQLRLHVEAKHPATVAPNATGKYRCTICGLLFETRYQLNKHSAKHSEEKRFKCDHCEYTTNEHNAFRRHKMRHNTKGAHLYQCSHCDYTCIQSTTYRRHLERSHEELASSLLYKCAMCAFVSISESKYQAHQAKHDRDTGGRQQTVPDGHDDEVEHSEEADEEDEIEEEHEDEHEPLIGSQWSGTDGLQLMDQRTCESVNSDVMIVDPREPPAPDILERTVAGGNESTPIHIVQQPIIRPAMFANNLSKVDNFYSYQQQQQLLQPKILKLTDRLPPHRVSPRHRSLQAAIPSQNHGSCVSSELQLLSVNAVNVVDNGCYHNLLPVPSSIGVGDQKQCNGVGLTSEMDSFFGSGEDVTMSEVLAEPP